MCTARTQLAATGRSAPESMVGETLTQPVLPASAIQPQDALSALSSKATLLDENSNLVFADGERIRLRIELTNGGDQDFQAITATLTGTASLLTQFSTTSLAIGGLRASQSRSIEFAATLPQSVQQQKTEIHVAVSRSGAYFQPPQQTLTLLIHPGGIRADDVDQIPSIATGFRQHHFYLISIGISSYRDQHIPSRKFASMNAATVSNYFQSLFGVLNGRDIPRSVGWNCLDCLTILSAQRFGGSVVSVETETDGAFIRWCRIAHGDGE